MKGYVENYLDYVQELSAEYSRNAAALKANDRTDEAILFKVRANICDIFYKMVNASEKKVAALKISDAAEEIKIFNEDYLNWFVKIPENWKTSLEQAITHNDPVTAKTEEVKLDTANLLKEKFIELAGEALSQANRRIQE